MSFIGKIIDLLLPPNCRLCGDLTEKREELCENCREKFIREAFLHCPACGCTADKCLCGAEFSHHIKEDIGGKLFSVLTFYDKSANDRVTEKLIFRLKDRGEFADFFAKEIARELKTLFKCAGEDISEWTVTYPPRSVGKFKEKGFDQGEEVATRLAKRLGIKCERTFVRCVAGTVQKTLNAKERKTNAEESLVPLRRHIKKGSKYIIFDDIITTGATVETVAKHLYFCGAAAIFPVAIAKALHICG